jgi:hypothetical protein
MKVSQLQFAASTEANASHGDRKAHPSLDALGKLVFGETAEAAESFTWTFPSPWNVQDNQGGLVYALANLTVTKIRASLTTGGYSCSYTISSGLTSQVYTGNNPPLGYNPQGFRLEARNAQNGVLFSYSWNQVLSCGANTLYQTATFDPDTYDIWATSTFCVLAFTHPRC